MLPSKPSGYQPGTPPIRNRFCIHCLSLALFPGNFCDPGMQGLRPCGCSIGLCLSLANPRLGANGCKHRTTGNGSRSSGKKRPAWLTDRQALVNNLLQHCLEPPPGHCDFLRGIFSKCHDLLPNRPQHVEGDHPAKQDDLGQKDVTVNDYITPTGSKFFGGTLRPFCRGPGR